MKKIVCCALLLGLCVSFAGTGYVQAAGQDVSVSGIAIDPAAVVAPDPAAVVTIDPAAVDAPDPATVVAPDPETVVLSVAQKEFEELTGNLTVENALLFTEDEEIISHVISYKEWIDSVYGTADSMEAPAAGGTVLYTLWPDEAMLASYHLVSGMEQANEALYFLAQTVVTGRLNAYGDVVLAANSVIRYLNMANSYNYAENAEDYPLYVVEKRIDGKTCAVIICMFNDRHAIETVAIPVSAEVDMHLEPMFDQISRKTVRTEITDPMTEEMKNLAYHLQPVADFPQTPEELAVSLAAEIGGRANDAYLQGMSVPGLLTDLCLSCGIFSTEPTKVIGTELKEEEVALLLAMSGAAEFTLGEDYNMRSMLVSVLPSLLNGRFGGTNALAAQGIMRINTSCSGLDVDNKIYLLYYGDGEKEVPGCYVSIVKNGNGCYDVGASPIFAGNIMDTLGSQGEEGMVSFLAIFLGMSAE